jgi:hypothetical protein
MQNLAKYIGILIAMLVMKRSIEDACCSVWV